MKYIVDRVEDEFVVCQNIESKKLEDISKDLFLEDVSDGDVVKLEGNQFVKDIVEFEKRKKRIEEKFNKLKNN